MRTKTAVDFIKEQVEWELAFNGFFTPANDRELRTYFFILKNQMEESEYSEFYERMKKLYK